MNTPAFNNVSGCNNLTVLILNDVFEVNLTNKRLVNTMEMVFVHNHFDSIGGSECRYPSIVQVISTCLYPPFFLK